MKLHSTVLALVLLGAGAITQAATFSYYDYGPEANDPDVVEYIRVRGPIELGDAEKLRRLIISDRTRARRALGVMLESPGGSVDEAMKIGRIVRTMFYSAQSGGFGKSAGPGSICASACFLIYVAAVKREAYENTLGIHRIYVRPNTSSMTAARAAEMLRSANKAVRDYLEEMDVPLKFIDRMRASSSLEIDWLSMSDALDLGLFAPFWEEYLVQQCNYRKETHTRIFLSKSMDQVRQLLAQMSEFWTCYGRVMSAERREGLEKLPTLNLQ